MRTVLRELLVDKGLDEKSEDGKNFSKEFQPKHPTEDQ
jgi:hypothetical protein